MIDYIQCHSLSQTHTHTMMYRTILLVLYGSSSLIHSFFHFVRSFVCFKIFSFYLFQNCLDHQLKNNFFVLKKNKILDCLPEFMMAKFFFLFSFHEHHILKIKYKKKLTIKLNSQPKRNNVKVFFQASYIHYVCGRQKNFLLVFPNIIGWMVFVP